MDPFLQEYLERLGARLDAYTNAITSLTEKLDAHVVNTPTIAHNPPSSATSPESTTDASAPVPDVSCSTTKAQEIPTVAHDATPICIPMVPVTCSTECSSQVDAIHSINEVHDAATVAADVRNTTTALGPELAVDLCITMAAIDVATCGHHDKLDALNIPAAVSISPLLHVQVPSPKGIPDSTRHVDVGRADEYELVAATPDVAIELAVLPGVSSFINKAHGASAVLHGAPLCCITMVPLTCSTECLNQDKGTLVFLPPITTMSLLPAAAPILVIDRLHSGTDAVDSMQLVRNHDLDDSPLPSIHTSSQVASEADHSAVLIVHSNLAALEPTKCSAECPAHVEQQPWTPPVQVTTGHIGHLFRPRPWPSFKFHSDASYQEEPCSSIRRQPHEVLWFSSGVVLKLFRDVVFPQLSCCEVISAEEYFSCLSVAQLQSRRPPDQAPPDTKALNELAFLNVDISACLSVDTWFGLRFLRINCRPIDTAPHTGRWIYLDFSNMGCQGQQSYACSIVHLMEGAEYFVHWDIIYDFVRCHKVLFATGLEFCRLHTKALQIVDEFGSTFQMELCHAGDLECNLPRHCIRIRPAQIFFLWSLKQNNGYACFTKQLLHEGKRWFLEPSACSISTALAMQHCYLPTMFAHLLQFMQSGPYELVCCSKISCLFCALVLCKEQYSENTFMLPGNLWLDKGCIQCHIAHREIKSKMLQPPGLLYVQSTCYVGVSYDQTYLKLNKINAVAVDMFENETNQVWELLICFKLPPDQHRRRQRKRDSKQKSGRSRARIQLIVLNDSLISRADDDQQHGFNPLQLVQMLCKVMPDSKSRSLNQWVMFTCGDIWHIHCTGIVDLVHQWACCGYTSRIIPTTISEGRIVQSTVAAITRQCIAPLCFLLPPVKIIWVKLSSLYFLSKSIHLSAAPFEQYDTPLSMEMINHMVVLNWNFWAGSTTIVVVEMDPTMASTEAWKRLCCQHLISLWAYQLLLDHMFERSNSHDWESLPFSNQRTSPAYFGMVDSSSARMCEWNLQCSVSKWLEEVGSDQNSEDCVPLGYDWGPLNPNGYQVSMSSCFHGYSFLYGLVLLQWEIAWTLHQSFLPSMTCAESTGKQEVTQGGRGDGAHVWYVCCIYYTQYCDQVLGGHNNYPNTSRRQAFVGHDYYYGVEVLVNYGYHCDHDQAKQHRVQWDPGGSRQGRLGVKPNLKKRGMLGALLAYIGLARPAHGPGPLENPQITNTQEETTKKGIQWITARTAPGGSLLLPLSLFLLFSILSCSSIDVCNPSLYPL